MTLKDRILAMPALSGAPLRAMYSDWEWEHDWRLNAYNHQLPYHNEWRVWNMIGPPATGKTWTGEHWMQDKLIHMERDTHYLVILQTRKHADNYFDTLYTALGGFTTDETGFPKSVNVNMTPNGDEWLEFPDYNSSLRVCSGPTTRLYGLRADYVWADNVADATEYLPLFPMAKQFLFTNPIKLVDGPGPAVMTTNGAGWRAVK